MPATAKKKAAVKRIFAEIIIFGRLVVEYVILEPRRSRSARKVLERMYEQINGQ